MADQWRFHTVVARCPKAPSIVDVRAVVRNRVESIGRILGSLPRGSTVAVTAGSRGIDRIAEIIRECCLALRSAGLKPLIVPAMGSHGGGTAEGQQQLLADYGITENQMGAPIVSSMETVPLGTTASGIEVVVDRVAWKAGGILVVNRVKPHTDFYGEVESGLMKMMAVGLGKLRGAGTVHRNSLHRGYDSTILEMGRCVLNSGHIVAGLGLVENDQHSICEIDVAPASDIERLDRRLLRRAYELYPRLPFPSLDLLVVDEIGKNISGAGMDAKVIGRPVFPELLEMSAPENIQIRRIYIRDLTNESEGNAVGIGFADAMHERIARKIDFQVTYTNARAGLSHNVVRMPMHFPDDASALEFLRLNMGSLPLNELRAVWIRNTLSVVTFRATPACIPNMLEREDFEIHEDEPVGFDGGGNLNGVAPGVSEEVPHGSSTS